MSAVSVNANSHPDPSGAWPLFSTSLAGFLFAPSSANRLLCAYPYDAGTTERMCSPLGVTDHCVPGCTPDYGAWGCHAGCNGPAWCTNEHRGWPCAWGPNDLSSALQIRERISQANGNTWENDVEVSYASERRAATQALNPFHCLYTASHTCFLPLLACTRTVTALLHHQRQVLRRIGHGL